MNRLRKTVTLIALVLSLFSCSSDRLSDSRGTEVSDEILQKEKLERLYLEILTAENFVSQNSGYGDTAAIRKLDSIQTLIYDYYKTDSNTMMRSLEHYAQYGEDIRELMDSMISLNTSLLELSQRQY